LEHVGLKQGKQNKTNNEIKISSVHEMAGVKIVPKPTMTV